MRDQQCLTSASSTGFSTREIDNAGLVGILDASPLVCSGESRGIGGSQASSLPLVVPLLQDGQR